MEVLIPAEQQVHDSGDPMQLDDDMKMTNEAFSGLSINEEGLCGSRRLQKLGCWRGRLPIGVSMHRPPKRISKWQAKDLEASRQRQKARATLLCDKLLGGDPLGMLSRNYQATIADWNTLVAETTPPGNVSSSSPRITHAFRAIDSIICGQQGSYLLRRLAYVQLMRLFDLLEDTIRLERETGQVIRGRYYRDSSVALDIYMSAQEDARDQCYLRRQLNERKRTGRSWRDLSKPSPLLVLMYPEAADRIM